MNSRRGVVIYRCVLPAVMLGSVGLGFFWLSMQRPPSWLASLELATGALCCCIAGWVAGSTWTKAYLTSAMERQVRTWRRIVDTMFGWIEEAPVPADSIHVLKRSLDKVILG